MQFEINFWVGAALLGGFLILLVAAAYGILLLVKLAQVIRGPSPKPPNEQIQQAHEHLTREHKETRARVIALEVWRNQLTEKLESDKQEILNAGETREVRLAEKVENVRRELDGKITTLETKVESIPERIVKLFRNIKTLKD